MKKLRFIMALAFLGMGLQAAVAQTTPAHALTNVTIHHADGSQTESAAVVWRDGVIEAAGSNVNIPFDAFEINGGDSLHVYPGFIDGFSEWGSPEPPKELTPVDNPGNPPYDRAGIQPERRPSGILQSDKDFAAAMKAGFTTAALVPEGFMLPGQVEVFYLSDELNSIELLQEQLAQSGSFEEAPGGWSDGVYPSTLMGVMAQFRQLMYDAEALQQHLRYYRQNPEMPSPERDPVIEALFPLLNKEVPLYFEVDQKEHIERLLKLQDEFGFEVVIVSGKEAYAKAGELKTRNIPVLASIDFTEMPDWYKKQKEAEESDKEKQEAEEKEVSEEKQAYREKQLEAWKAEVSNIRKLMDAGLNVGYASAGFDLKELSNKLEILLDEGGLSEAEAVALMTQNTAEILGLNDRFGELKKGKNASFVVFNKPFTKEKARVLYSISNGAIHEFNGEEE